VAEDKSDRSMNFPMGLSMGLTIAYLSDAAHAMGEAITAAPIPRDQLQALRKLQYEILVYKDQFVKAGRAEVALLKKAREDSGSPQEASFQGTEDTQPTK
jgi:hypothetical protein